mmetsp:Transcript_37717/g.81391  ORF Transcript_37717/g.81391 Transcript_37717/m.81391 type:complete len:356 (+) Transcript_37717:2-1069(+)
MAAASASIAILSYHFFAADDDPSTKIHTIADDCSGSSSGRCCGSSARSSSESESASSSPASRSSRSQVMQQAILDWQQKYLQKSTTTAAATATLSNSSRWNSSSPFLSLTECEAVPIATTTLDDEQKQQLANNISTTIRATTNDDSKNDDDGTHPNVEQMDYYYIKMEPNDIERTSLTDSHAVFGALLGEGLIERYNVYRRVNLENEAQHRQQQSSPISSSLSKRELTVVDLKLGNRLNGHAGIAHGGIISLLFDEAMGWACVCLNEEEDSLSLTSATTTANNNNNNTDNAVVTANLTIDFRAPFFEGSEGVVRVYHDETKGRKIYFSATLESLDGKVVFAEAKSLFIRVRLDRL